MTVSIDQKLLYFELCIKSEPPITGIFTIKFQASDKKSMGVSTQSLKLIIVEKPKPEVPKMTVAPKDLKISRDGFVAVGFSEPMVVPDFISLSDSSLARRLAEETETESQIEPARENNELRGPNVEDIFDIEIICYSDVEQVMLGFTPEFESWTGDAVKIKLNFDNPLFVSMG